MTGSIRETAATRQRAAAVPATTEAPTSGSELVRRAIAKFAGPIAKLLEGTGIKVETFTAQIGTAYRTTPGLWECDPATVLGAALKCAQLGLAPNDARNLAWIVPYADRRRDDGQKVATFQIGYGGALELARRAVAGLRFDGRPVYPNDDFDLCYGRTPPLLHVPAVARNQPRGGDAFAWYVRAIYPGGDEIVHVLDREQVEYHRSFSKVSGGMWETSYDAAALKSVVMDMRRFLPSSAQFAAGLAAEQSVNTPDGLEAEQAGEATYDRPPVDPAGEPDASSQAAAQPDGTDTEAGTS